MWRRTVFAYILFFCVLAATTSADAVNLLGFTNMTSRLAVQRAVQGAAVRLARPGCQDVLNDLADQSGRALGTKLAASGTSVADAFRSLRFYDDARAWRCRTGTALAFTEAGSLLIRVCGNRFTKSLSQNSTAAEIVVIHEFLHALGLGENPPTSGAITERVALRCGS
jgi:hypothetical protein